MKKEEIKALWEARNPQNKGSLGDFEYFFEIIKAQQSHGKLLGFSMQHSPKAFSSFPKEKDPIFMGFEWEMSPPSGSYTDIVKKAVNTDLSNFLNFRADGSHLEMVSIPATLDFHKSYMKDLFFDKNFDILNANSPSYYGAGVHIHISKDAFTAETLKKFVTFTLNLANFELLNSIAERPYHVGVAYRSPNPGKLTYHKSGRFKGRLIDSDVSFNERLVQVDSKVVNGCSIVGKGNAVNSGTSYGTVEFRIFNSAKTQESLFKYLEFTDALVRFCRDVEMRDLYTYDFAKFVKRNHKKYPNLFADPVIQEHLPKKNVVGRQ